MVNFLIFGPPGSGKGTQAEFISEKYNLVHLSTGDMLREETALGSEIGIRLETIMKDGELVPDEVVIEMIAHRIDNNPEASGFLFDGFPRTLNQAVALDKMLEERRTVVGTMLALDVEHNELVKRLLGRAKTSKRSDDMKESVIENRIRVYRQKTTPVADYYRESGRFDTVMGMGDIDHIFGKLCKVIDKYL